MPITLSPPAALEDVAHTIQVALTPVFLLSGIGTLINVFTARLARVADQIDRAVSVVASADPDGKPAAAAKLASLRLRLFALDAAVILGAIGGVATSASVLTLFYGTLRDAVVASTLYALFATAILCTMAALSAFVFEMLLASHVLRTRVTRSEAQAGL